MRWFLSITASSELCIIADGAQNQRPRNDKSARPKDSDDSLDSKKNLGQKLANWIGAQGRVKLAKRRKNTSTCDVPHREPKTIFVFMPLRRLAESVGGLNSSQILSARELRRCKAWAKSVSRGP